MYFMWLRLSVTYSALSFFEEFYSLPGSICFCFGCYFASNVSFLQPSHAINPCHIWMCRNLISWIISFYFHISDTRLVSLSLFLFFFVNVSKRSAALFAASTSWHWEFIAPNWTEHKGSNASVWGHDTLLPPQPCFYLLVFFSPSVVCEWERPQRHNFSFVGDDYFHNSSTLHHKMWLTQNGWGIRHYMP